MTARFEAGQAVERARGLGLEEARPAGTEAERVAGDRLAAAMAEAGWEVDRQEVVGSRLPELVQAVLGWGLLGLWPLLALVRTTRPGRLPDPEVMRNLLALSWLWFLGAMAGRFRLGGGLPPRVRSRTVLAGRGSDAPVRVVFASALDTALPGWSVRDRIVLDGLLAALLATFTAFSGFGRPFPLAATVALVLVWVGWALSTLVAMRTRPAGEPSQLGRRRLVGLATVGCWTVLVLLVPDLRVWIVTVSLVSTIWFVALMRIVGPVFASRPAGPALASGPALLMELARTWPKGRQGRIEAHFVAVGAQGLGDDAGARALARAIRNRWPDRPTLVVWLDRPGVGEVQVLAGRGEAVGLASAAARDLWVPFRVLGPIAERGQAGSMLRPFAQGEIPAVRLGGEPWANGPVRVEALGAAGQLATEVALRWARRQAERREVPVRA